MKRINKNQTFENFSVNDGNAWALAALKKVIEDKNYFNPVYIYGEEGVGKSHLLNATINTIVELNKVAFISAKELSDEIIENVMLSDDMNDPIIISERFKYFGKSPLELPKNILDFFPMGSRSRLAGKPFPRWNTKNGFYNSNERSEDTKELMNYITELLGEKNEVVDLPYHPMYIKGEN